jgi:hypothetical protein
MKPEPQPQRSEPDYRKDKIGKFYGEQPLSTDDKPKTALQLLLEYEDGDCSDEKFSENMDRILREYSKTLREIKEHESATEQPPATQPQRSEHVLPSDWNKDLPVITTLSQPPGTALDKHDAEVIEHWMKSRCLVTLEKYEDDIAEVRKTLVDALEELQKRVLTQEQKAIIDDALEKVKEIKMSNEPQQRSEQSSRDVAANLHKINPATDLDDKGNLIRHEQPPAMEQQMALKDVLREREAQQRKWGEQNHEMPVWLEILHEETGELCEADLHARFGGPKMNDVFKEAVQVAAVGLQIVEYLRRQKPDSLPVTDDRVKERGSHAEGQEWTGSIGGLITDSNWKPIAVALDIENAHKIADARNAERAASDKTHKREVADLQQQLASERNRNFTAEKELRDKAIARIDELKQQLLQAQAAIAEHDAEVRKPLVESMKPLVDALSRIAARDGNRVLTLAECFVEARNALDALAKVKE